MSDRVGTAVQGLKSPGSEPELNRFLTESHREQLPPSHDTVLAVGERRQTSLAFRRLA